MASRRSRAQHTRYFHVLLVAFAVLLYHAGAQGPVGNDASVTTRDRLEDPGWWPTKGDSARSLYVGSEACKSCHQAIATLQGTAGNPDVLPGTAYFQYGTSSKYGHSTPVQSIGAQTAGAVSARLTKLAPGTYHYRLVVTNPDGTSYGADSTLQIASAPKPSALTNSRGTFFSTLATAASGTGTMCQR